MPGGAQTKRTVRLFLRELSPAVIYPSVGEWRAKILPRQRRIRVQGRRCRDIPALNAGPVLCSVTTLYAAARGGG
jgi:hypothetical protein